MRQERRLVAVFAHPDDESFGTGGTLAKYSAEGVQVHLVCATRGEVGEISEGSLATPETLPQAREQELRAACRVLGVREPVFLGYRDSGMAGTPENEHPQSLHRARTEEVVGKLTALLRKLRPQVVVTFDAVGGYGHPDHIAIHRYTTAAVEALNAEGVGIRLYYSTIPRSVFRRLVERAPEDSSWRRLDVERFGTPDESIRTRVDVSAFVDVKMAAIMCHRTQVPAGGPFAEYPEAEVRRFLGTEHFLRAVPPDEGVEVERELFPNT